MSTPRKPLGEAEFNQLFHTYHKPVFLYLQPADGVGAGQEALLLFPEDGEGLLGQVLHQVGVRRVAAPGQQGVYVTAANLARNHLRTQQRWAGLLAQVEPETLENLPHPRPQGETLLELEGVVEPEELDLLRRVYLEGCSYQELAQELGVKPNTLASRVSRIKAKFRKNFPESEKFLQDGCKESRPPGHKKGRGGFQP